MLIAFLSIVLLGLDTKRHLTKGSGEDVCDNVVVYLFFIRTCHWTLNALFLSTQCSEFCLSTIYTHPCMYCACSKNVTVCGPGYEETVGPTSLSNRECAMCVKDQTFSPGEEPCSSIGRCFKGQYEAAPPTISTDRLCLSW